MPTGRVSKRTVDALQPAQSDVFLWDEELRGFGLRLKPSGHRSYVVQYRIPGLGRRGFAKRIVLGTHGKLTPDQARQIAKQQLGKAAQGVDLAAERAERRRADGMREFGETYLKEVRARHKVSTAIEYERLWKKHVDPALGNKILREVNQLEVRRLHRSLHKTPYLANRVLAMLGGFFSYAAREGVRLANGNPAHDIEFYPESPRERFLTENEFRRLGEALSLAERKGLPPAPSHRRQPSGSKTAKHRPKTADRPIPASPFAVAAIRLLALTGCRENEILSLTWDMVDVERGYLRFPDTKTRKSVRPLSGSAAALIDALPRLDGSRFVFPGAKPGEHLKDIKRLWSAVRHSANLLGVRLHDLRHSYASVSASSGESMLVLSRLSKYRMDAAGRLM